MSASCPGPGSLLRVLGGLYVGPSRWYDEEGGDDEEEDDMENDDELGPDAERGWSPPDARQVTEVER